MKYSGLFLPTLLAINIGVTLSLAVFWFQPEDAVWLVTDYVYYEILAATIIFSVYSFRLARKHLGAFKPEIWLAMSLAALVGTGFLVTREAPNFKIVQDEYVVSTTALNIHLQHRIFASVRSYYANNEFITGIDSIDKRQNFFPVLLATVHDIFGYEVNNVFRLNAVITFALLLVTGMIGYLFNRLPGTLFALFLVVSIPLFAQNASGAGFELLNLLMILITLLLAWLHLAKRDSETLTALVFSAILLAQTRYESILFLVAVGIIALIGWLRSGRLPLNPYLLASPFFLLIPLVHLSWIIQSDSVAVWQTPGGASSAFNYNFLASNSLSALKYYLTPSIQSSMNAYVGILLLESLAIFLYIILTKAHRGLSNKQTTLLLFLIIALLNFYILMCYFWGNVRDPVVSRLTLPLTMMGILSLIALCEFSLWNIRIFAAYLAISFYFTTLPATSASHYTNLMEYAQHSAWPADYLMKHVVNDNYLVIATRSLPFITKKMSSILPGMAIKKADKVKFQLESGAVAAIYVVQVVYFDPKTNATAIAPAHELGKQYRLETLAEHHFTPLHRTRISKVVGITPDPDDKPGNYPGYAEAERTGNIPDAPVTRQQILEQIRRLP
jgi:hypothetical protein